MVQHILLVLVAAPLVALGAPGAAIVRGAPAVARRTLARWRRPLGSVRAASRRLGTPIPAWLLHVGTLWFWHAALPYDAAVENDAVHAVSHVTLIFTAIVFWRAVLPPLATFRAPTGVGILLVFAMGLQSVFLSALLTFATTPWYAAYAETTEAWGLTTLEDQQIAGAIMWVPASLIYASAGLALVVAWIRSAERSPIGLTGSLDRPP
jgi:cytochrome c oxidase assembly factor CtaG